MLKNRKKFILTIGMIFACLQISACSSKQENPTEIVSVSYDGIPYVGMFSGGYTEKGNPNGTGTVTVDTDEMKFVINGTWENGELEGSGEIKLSDNSVIYTEFRNNVMHGDAKRVYDDGTYATYAYTNGYPSGMVIYYNEKEEIIGIDRYYNNQLIEEWCRISEELDYAEALKSPDALYMQPIKVEGVVTDIYNSDKSAYIIIKNKDDQSFIFTYKNTNSTKCKVLVKHVEIGDEVIGYGHFDRVNVLNKTGLYKVNTPVQVTEKEFEFGDYIDLDSVVENEIKLDNSILYSSLPVINMFYADDKSNLTYKSLKLEEEEYDYVDLIEFPYHFTGFKLKDSVKVLKMTINYSSEKAMLLLQKEDNKLYYGVYSFSDDKQLPQIGQIVDINAEIDGIYKLMKQTSLKSVEDYSYVLIPNLIINKIEF